MFKNANVKIQKREKINSPVSLLCQQNHPSVNIRCRTRPKGESSNEDGMIGRRPERMKDEELSQGSILDLRR